MRFVTLIFVVFFLELEASATIHHVFPGILIQMAVDTAVSGDTILIHDGEYEETVVLNGKCLIIGSDFMLEGDTTHIASTTISPSARSDTGSVFVYSYGEAEGSELCGLTLQNGAGTTWGAGGEVTGGAVFVSEAHLSVSHCRVLRSRAIYGGGLAVVGQWPSRLASLKLDQCVVEGCTALEAGGAVYARDCSLLVSRCVFLADSSLSRTAGVRVTRSYAVLDASVFSRCVGYYGAVWYGENSGLIANCIFEKNAALGFGGATDLEYYENHASVTRCVFRDNESSNNAIVTTGFYETPLRFFGNLIEGDTTYQSSGTMIVTDQSVGDIAYNVFRNNLNSNGGTIFNLNWSSVCIHHNVFTGNAAVDDSSPSAVLSITRARPSLDSNVVSGNSSPAVGFVTGHTVLIDARNNYWGDPTGPYHPTLNPEGRGDTILQDSVLFVPWLTSPPDTSMPDLSVYAPRPVSVATWELVDLFPNPFNSEIRIILAGFTGRDFRITLHDLLGREVATLHCGPLTGGELHFRAPPHLSSGVYFVRAASRDAVRTRKAVFLK